MQLQDIIKNRRTHKLFDGTAISLDKITAWLEVAIHSPNHYRTEPWRFLVLPKDQLLSFWTRIKELLPKILARIGADKVAEKAVKLEKLFKTSGAVVFVLCRKDADADTEREDYAAVCCAIQNLMLLAESEKVGSFWSTGEVFSHALSAKLVGYNHEKYILAGTLFLGQPGGKPVSPAFSLEGKMKVWNELQGPVLPFDA